MLHSYLDCCVIFIDFVAKRVGSRIKFWTRILKTRRSWGCQTRETKLLLWCYFTIKCCKVYVPTIIKHGSTLTPWWCDIVPSGLKDHQERFCLRLVHATKFYDLPCLTNVRLCSLPLSNSWCLKEDLLWKWVPMSCFQAFQRREISST